MFKTWRACGLVGNHTRGRWPAGPDLGPVPPARKKEVAVAGPPFIIIIMALMRCPSPPRALKRGKERPSRQTRKQPRKTRRQAAHATRLTIVRTHGGTLCAGDDY